MIVRKNWTSISLETHRRSIGVHGRGEMMSDYYILERHKAVRVDIGKWGKWFEKTERHVKDETIDGVRVSTVFLGLDHSFGDGPPLLFETLIFDGKLDGEMDRYTTWEEAEVGHKNMVDRVKAEQKRTP